MVFSNWMSSAHKMSALLFLFLWTAAPIYSQALEKPFVQLQSSSGGQQSQLTQGTLHVIAAMVEFQPDTTRFTSGDGTFTQQGISYLENDDVTIDPLPHDQQYFEAHLEFAKNYFEKMSGGKLQIRYNVLDAVFQLPAKMANYSPVGFDPSSEPLAEFAQDAWNSVAQAGSLDLDLGPSDDIAFVLFHAGVGRDIELTGTVLEKTPQDIPSVYLSKDAFRQLFNDPSFSGFPIDGGNLLVDHTIILPRTLTRVGEDVTGAEVLLQLSTNGMVTAQIGSHLGLPDLFNTENGESGIGRFGLMDGAGIFAYNGLFPPELSAWEKIHMGWAEPFEPGIAEESEIELPASSLNQDNSIARVPLSSTEYFLVENRHREAGEQGTTLTIRQPDGSSVQQTFTNSDTSFVFQQSDFAEQLESGVVTNVSNYDFALPGGISEFLDETDDNADSDRILNGGILIWHIDEAIINNRLASGVGINSDPDRRGVRLVEADGAQDIGRPTAIGFFENDVNGSAFDFWWSDNDASVITPTGTITLYENRFGPNTTPSNDSNSGAKSAFELFDFSDNLPNASFQIQPVNIGGELFEIEDFVQNLPFNFSTPGDDPYWSRYPLSIFSTGRGSEFILPGRDGVLFRNSQGDLTPFPSGEASQQQPIYNRSTGTITVAPNPEATDQDMTVSVLQESADEFTELWNFQAEPNGGLISSPSSDLLQFDGTPARAAINSQTFDEDFYSAAGHRSEVIRGYESSISNSGEIELITPGETFTVSGPALSLPSRRHIGLIEQTDGGFLTFLFLENDLILLEPGPAGVESRLISSSQQMEWPALADFDRSGDVDFLFVDQSENHLTAKNMNGAVLSGFPIVPPDGVRFTGTPLIADLDGNSEFEIIITGLDQQSNNLYAYSQNGTLLDEFPLLVGGVADPEDQPVNPSVVNQYLTAVSQNGDFRVWKFQNMGRVLWSSRYGNSGNNKLTGRLLSEPPATPDFGLLNDEETYNWPNPARDETFIRYQTSAPGDVQIEITTISGRLIYDRTVRSNGGGPEEISVNTSSWGSGGYIAVITASVNGETERKRIKIAIAK